MPEPSSTAPSVPPCLSPESGPAWARLLNYVRHNQRRTLLVVRHNSPRIPRELSPLLAAETGRPLVVATVSDVQPDPMSAAMAAAPDGQFVPETILSITGAEDLAVSSPEQSSTAALYEFARRLDLRRDQLLPKGGVVVVWATERVFDVLAEHALNFISLSSAVLSLVAGDHATPVTQPSIQAVTFETLRERYRIPVLPTDAPDDLRAAFNAFEELAVADELYLQGGSKIAYALARYDAARDRIEAGWNAARHWGDLGTSGITTSSDAVCDFADALLAAYPDTGGNILSLRQHPRERIVWHEAALAASRRRGDRPMEGLVLGHLGLAWIDLGNARQAISYYEQALAIFREIGDRGGESAALGNLGSAWGHLGETPKAISCLEQALALAREIGDQRSASSTLSNLGIAWADLGDSRKAIDCYERGLAIFRRIGDRRGEGAALGNLGIAWAVLGDARKAIGYYEQQLLVVREIGDRRGEGSALANCGASWAALGDIRKAIDYTEQALVVFREIGDQLGEANALFNSALRLVQIGDYLEARPRAEQAAAILVAIEAPNAERARQLAVKLREAS